MVFMWCDSIWLYLFKTWLCASPWSVKLLLFCFCTTTRVFPKPLQCLLVKLLQVVSCRNVNLCPSQRSVHSQISLWALHKSFHPALLFVLLSPSLPPFWFQVPESMWQKNILMAWCCHHSHYWTLGEMLMKWSLGFLPTSCWKSLLHSLALFHQSKEFCTMWSESCSGICGGYVSLFSFSGLPDPRGWYFHQVLHCRLKEATVLLCIFTGEEMFLHHLYPNLILSHKPHIISFILETCFLTGVYVCVQRWTQDNSKYCSVSRTIWDALELRF